MALLFLLMMEKVIFNNERSSYAHLQSYFSTFLFSAAAEQMHLAAKPFLLHATAVCLFTRCTDTCWGRPRNARRTRARWVPPRRAARAQRSAQTSAGRVRWLRRSARRRTALCALSLCGLWLPVDLGLGLFSVVCWLKGEIRGMNQK